MKLWALGTCPTCAMLAARERMRTFDQMPRDCRDLANEIGLNKVLAGARPKSAEQDVFDGLFG